MDRFDKILLGMTGAFMSLAMVIYGVSMHKSDKRLDESLRNLEDIELKLVRPNDSESNPNE